MATATATIDFGAYPGKSLTSVNVPGFSGLTTGTAGSLAEAFFMADSTADHTVNDHIYAPSFIRLVCEIVDASNVLVYATAADQMQGTFFIRVVVLP
jgi:hypothetical protein